MFANDGAADAMLAVAWCICRVVPTMELVHARQKLMVNAWGDYARESFLFLHVFIINKQSRDSLYEYNKYTMLPLISVECINLAGWLMSESTCQVAERQNKSS
jgi:hypothetical protein